MFLKKINLTLLSKIRSFYRPNISLSTSTPPKEQKIKVGKHEINYLKVGHGPHVVFCGSSSIGTIWSDFEPQIYGFDRDKFSLVISDGVGKGKSSPDHENAVDFFHRDAEVTYELMQALRIPYYSYMGWSSGGASGFILAAKQPEVVHKLAVWGTSSYITPRDAESYKMIKDLKNWSKPNLQMMIDIYGKEEFEKKLHNWTNKILNNYKTMRIDYLLKDIKCPTLILYGEKDPMVEASHVEHLQKHIKNSRVHLYPNGKHNIHEKYAEDFNRRVQDFFLLDGP